jgi:acetyltransferase-like isoleucine patch superfamily enzyme
MNPRSFARGMVYSRPHGVQSVFSKVLILIYKIIEKIRAVFIRYIVWDLFTSKAIIGENCLLAEEAYLNNTGDRQNIIIGDNVAIRGILYAEFGGRITIGNNVYMGDNTIFSSYEEITVGNNVLISHNVNIFDNDSHPRNYLEREEHYLAILRGDWNLFKKDKIANARIVIEDNVWISFNCTILKGVTIGKGAIISADSIVLHDVPPFSIVKGVH